MTAEKAEQKPTSYVVLERIEVPHTDPERQRQGEKLEAWIVLDTAEAKTKNGAIAAVTGDAEGTFKGVPASSWRGGVTQAQAMMLKREAIE